MSFSSAFNKWHEIRSCRPKMCCIAYTVVRKCYSRCFPLKDVFREVLGLLPDECTDEDAAVKTVSCG